MAKVVKKVTQKKVTATKKTVKPTAKKATVKNTPKCKCTKVQKVSVKSVKTPVVPAKKSFWKKVAEFFGF